MFYLFIFIYFYPLNELIWCLLHVSKKLARGQQRAEKAIHFEKIQLGEHLPTIKIIDIRSVT